MLNRRAFLVATAGAGLAAAQRTAAAEQINGWPSKPIRVIFPTGAGGPSEIFRMYGEYMKEVFGQPFLYENKPGGSGSIGTMEVVRSAPDGHTLMVGSNSFTILVPLVFANSPVNTKRDLAPIALLFSYRFLLVVNPKLGVKTWQEFVDYAKARPGELNYGSPGIGTGGHLVTELMLKRAGIKAVHVPYQGNPQVITALLSGEVQMALIPPGLALPQVRAGKLQAVGLTTGRSTLAPDVAPLADGMI